MDDGEFEKLALLQLVTSDLDVGHLDAPQELGIENEAVVGNQDEVLAGNQDQALFGNQDEVLAGNEDEILAGNKDEILAGIQDEVLIGNNDEALGGNDLQVAIEENQGLTGYPPAELETQIDLPDLPHVGDVCPTVQIEVAVPGMPLDRSDGYEEVYSSTVERVFGSFRSGQYEKAYQVEFADGREELLSLDQIFQYKNGRTSLYIFKKNQTDLSTGFSRKRKALSEDGWDSSSEHMAPDLMDLDDDEDNDENEVVGHVHSRRISTSQGRLLRSREASKRRSLSPKFAGSDDNDEISHASSRPRRQLRQRKPQQLKLTEMTFKSRPREQDRDELSLDPAENLSDEEDDDFLPVISDIAIKNTAIKKKFKASQSKRLHAQRTTSKRSAKMCKKTYDDSDIEFEQPRRSSRATKNMQSMRDDSFLDDESFYIADDRSPAVPKVISIKEVFKTIAADSSFGLVHMETCHTCSGSRQRGQLLYCQGCSLSFHKNCIGYRSARDHQATKVGEDDFVLQCRFCIDLAQKRDPNAPTHSMCQGCKKRGQACAAFSEKKTTRQEEKLREENGRVDPITPVSPRLINNADVVLLRCISCSRAWHQEHLPSDASESLETDIKAERLQAFSSHWRCDECSSTKHKLHRLVAWRPVQRNEEPSRSISFEDVGEDWKEYLVKWKGTSYSHCTWKPGAWIFGVAIAVMRSAFGKRVVDHSELLAFNEKEVIPDEFLMPDIIFNVKMDSSVTKGKSKEDDLANISKVTKILVKFQGLGYDDVVWDSIPTQDNPEMYNAFVEAYRDYIEGSFFHTESYYKIRERVRAYKNEPFTELDVQPAGLKRGKLMGYQMEGLNWLLQNYHHGRNVVLADEMGLGKTVQVISLVTTLVQDEPKCWPFLIVVPNSTCPNWRREFRQWAPDLRVVTYHGGKEPQDLAYKYELFPNGSKEMKADIVIMSYDSAQDPRTLVLFKSVHWAGLIVDEGQRLKNDQNLLYYALRAMKIPFRLLLTGTPLQNNKRELFNLLQFIDETQNAAKLDEEFSVLDKETLPKLHEKIRPYFLRRTKAGVLKFLPPMAQIILPVTMTVIQERLAKSILAKNPQLIKAMFANSKMKSKERGSLNNILMQLRKCLCHPFLYSEAIEDRRHDPTVLHRNLVEASAKLLLLEIMLPKLKERGHRVLIFSQFLGQLDIIEDFLSGIGFGFRRLDGQISSLEKQRRIDAFNEPDSDIFAFLLSTRAGGVGINLATADTVIIMDPDFNPHQDMQALSRAHRIGQKNKVLCFQLVTKDSVEERIMQVGRKKMALDHALIESMDDDELAGDDLESILKHGAQALFDENYQKNAIQYDSASVDKLLDRSQVEQTETSEEGSAETQFTYARVWANDKLSFEENQDLGEETAPEPINSSVWDNIIAQREEEARQEAEASKEVLGRGARRRLAINYKNNAIDPAQYLEEGAQSSSDSSDDEFKGGESPRRSDEEGSQSEEDEDWKAELDSKLQAIEQGAEPRKRRRTGDIIAGTSVIRSDVPRPARKQATSTMPVPIPQSPQVPPGAGTYWPPAPLPQQLLGQPVNGFPILGPLHPDYYGPPSAAVVNPYNQYHGYHDMHPPFPNSGVQTGGARQADPQNIDSLSKAQLRLAIDLVQRSAASPEMKQRQTSALRRRLGQISVRNGT